MVQYDINNILEIFIFRCPY